MKQGKTSKLSGQELDQIDAFLATAEGAMGLEEIDGLFCAMVSSIDPVPEEEWVPYVFGGSAPDTEADSQAREMVELLIQHCNHINLTLLHNQLYYPILYEDDSGKCQASDWARGYMRGVQMREESWTELLAETEHAALLGPQLLLCVEHQSTQDGADEPWQQENRDCVIDNMIDSVLEIYRCFTPYRRLPVIPTFRREQPKVGRNDPCPCGSGKKFKKCHGMDA